MKKALKDLIENAEGTIKGAYETGYSDGRAARDAEIVRCKECKYHDEGMPGAVYCPNLVGGWVSERFFCAGGERRTDDGEI